MNAQLWDLLEDKIDFVDDEIPDAPEPPAGIRAKIGEDVYQLLSNTRLAVVGECRGPHMFDITELIGKEETLRRLRVALERITPAND